MKLYRTSLGKYHLRDKQPIDIFDRPVWEEVQLSYEVDRGYVKIAPVKYPEDVVTLTSKESVILITSSLSLDQHKLALWFTIRQPDQLLARFAPSTLEFGSKDNEHSGIPSYAEFGFDGAVEWTDFKTEGNEDSDRTIVQAMIVALQRKIGEMP